MRQLLTLLFLTTLGTAGICAQQPTNSDSPNQPVYEIGVNGVKAPVPLNQVQLLFPPEAREKQISGKCAVSFLVDVEGRPRQVKVIRCTDSVFADASSSAVKKYRFTPATTQDGKPVPVISTSVIAWDLYSFTKPANIPEVKVRCEFSKPPRTTLSAPDAEGIYPLTDDVIPPKLIQFSDDGYQMIAFTLPGNSPCDMLLTIDANGKASDPQNVQCQKPSLANAATKSLLDSRFQPGSLKGVNVPVRASVHLEFVSFAPAP
jgi:TonB family protein